MHFRREHYWRDDVDARRQHDRRTCLVRVCRSFVRARLTCFARAGRRSDSRTEARLGHCAVAAAQDRARVVAAQPQEWPGVVLLSLSRCLVSEFEGRI